MFPAGLKASGFLYCTISHEQTPQPKQEMNPLCAHLDLLHLLPLFHTFTQEEFSGCQLLVNLKEMIHQV